MLKSRRLQLHACQRADGTSTGTDDELDGGINGRAMEAARHVDDGEPLTSEACKLLHQLTAACELQVHAHTQRATQPDATPWGQTERDGTGRNQMDQTAEEQNVKGCDVMGRDATRHNAMGGPDRTERNKTGPGQNGTGRNEMGSDVMERNVM